MDDEEAATGERKGGVDDILHDEGDDEGDDDDDNDDSIKNSKAGGGLFAVPD